MYTTERLVEDQGREMHLMVRLDGKQFEVPDAH